MVGFGYPLDSLILKLERARKHILELESGYEAFIKSDPYHIDFKVDSNAGQRSYYLTKADPVPLGLSLPLGDAINSLRSTLDHIAYALVQVGQPSKITNQDIFFPVGGSPNEYETRLKRVQPGLRDDAIKALNATEPYEGGHGEYLWSLSLLNNIDKHRLLLTIWGSLEAHTILPTQRAEIATFHRRKEVEFRGHFIAPKNRLYPLKVGDVLLPSPKPKWSNICSFA